MLENMTAKLPLYHVKSGERSWKIFGTCLGILAFTVTMLNLAITTKALSDLRNLREELDVVKLTLMELEIKKARIDSEDYEMLDADYENFTDANNDDDYSYYDNSNKEIEIEPKVNSMFTKDLKTRDKRNIDGYSDDQNRMTPDSSKPETKWNVTEEIETNYNPHRFDTSTLGPTYTRKPRVLYQDHFSRSHRPIGKKASSLFRPTESTENVDVETVLHQNDGHAVRQPRMGRIRPLPSAHFSGDTSQYVFGIHENFKGNGHLRHPQRTYIDWRQSEWVRNIGMDRHFEFHNGILTVKETGLYFVYAQIFYLDEHDVNGFKVYKNKEPLLQCTTTTHSEHKVLKGNTCYTAAAEYLEEGDVVSLADISDSRYSLFEPGKSFFGLIKLGDARSK